MHSTYLLPFNDCSLENALLWGMSKHHFHQARIQNQLDQKIIHLVLALLEAIPILGQIISLIELTIARTYTYPQPISCIPHTELVKTQNSAEELMRIWPKNLSLLFKERLDQSITQKEMEAKKEEIDRHLRTIRSGTSVTTIRRKLTYTTDGKEVNVTLPIGLALFDRPNEVSHLLLLSKAIVFTGGERKIRRAYDVTTGTFYLKKRIVGLFEERILKTLPKLRAQRDIHTSVIWRKIPSKIPGTPEKLQIIEPIRDGTLSILFGTEPLSHFPVKHALITDLLADLVDLHSLSLSNCKITTRSFPWVDPVNHELPKFTVFHADIKIANVLVFLQDGKWRAELCDFGCAADPTKFVISIGFTPPEYITFYKSEHPRGIFDKSLLVDDFKLAQFNIEHGPKRDIWSMGLVILSLLVEREKKAIWENRSENKRYTAQIPPLPCLKKVLSGTVWTYDEEKIVSLTQKDIDDDLAHLEKEMVCRYPEEVENLEKIFYMLKNMMLRINPVERETSHACFAFLQNNQPV
jgi:serine/threonine protein kinase